MQYTYSTFIEMVRGKDFRIVGVANNPLSRNDIPNNILSKGKAFGCIELKYSIKTPLENGGYIVYTIDGKKEDYENDTREFLPMKIRPTSRISIRRTIPHLKSRSWIRRSRPKKSRRSRTGRIRRLSVTDRMRWNVPGISRIFSAARSDRPGE